ncbi:uncharacterized protein TNCT_427631 [Trichonephila clavata]|uniref:Gustatory receptor n=1 Tax=Trichonephila clavata TaxID=2740835 RepID=A0A8X6HPT5_TRICU|nr:uncharacterized protein TNCT_427631 [Trichonephila clavata]
MEAYRQLLKGSLQPFSTVTMVMFAVGLDVRSYRRNTGFHTSRISYFYQKLLFFLWLVYLIHVLATMVGSDVANQVGVNTILARKMPEIIAFLVWAVMMTRRKEVSILLYDIYHLGSVFNKEFRPLWVKLGALVCVLTSLLSWLSILLSYTEEECKSLLVYYNLNFEYTPDGEDCKIIHILNIFYQIATYTLQNAVAVLYVIICCFLSDLLNTHAKLGCKRMDNLSVKFEYNYIRNYLTVHESILKVLKSLEKTMSLPIFLIEICDCIGLFYGLVKLDSIERFSVPFSEVQYLKISFVSLRALASFLCVSFAASSVHEASKNTKDAQEGMLKRILVSKRMIDTREVFLLFVSHNGTPFALSAWGFFYFTKGVVLATAGSILTYSLLMLQIAR